MTTPRRSAIALLAFLSVIAVAAVVPSGVAAADPVPSTVLTASGPGYATRLTDWTPSVPAVFSPTATTLTWLLPAEAASMGLTSVTYTCDALNRTRTTGTAPYDAATNSVVVPLPPGFAATAVANAYENGSEPPYVFCSLVQLRDADPAASMPSATANTNGLGLWFELELSIGVAPSSTATNVTLDLTGPLSKNGAQIFSHWVAPASGSTWAVPGETIGLSLGTSGTWEGSATAYLQTKPGEDPKVTVPVIVSADKVTANVTLPDASALTGFLDGDGNVVLDVRSLDTTGHQQIMQTPLRLGVPTALPGVVSSRLAGPDRITTAIHITRAAFPNTYPTAYLATGSNFPDALSAAAAAAHEGGPLLLTDPVTNSLTLMDNMNLGHPKKIVVVGGSGRGAIQPGELELYAPTLLKLAGSDRYGTSRLIAQQAFTAGATPTAFIATGEDFPDALSATAAAASVGAPLILVRGDAPRLDAPTLALLKSLGVHNVTIAGGTGVVSAGIQTQLATLLIGEVKRLGGSDRFETSRLIVASYFAHAPEALIASGMNFPDAMAGGALAGATHTPLLLAQPNCVPQGDLDLLTTWGTSHVTLLGGIGVLSSRVQSLQACG